MSKRATVVRQISNGVMFKKNPERFIVYFKAAIMRIDVVNNTPEPRSWRKPNDPTQYPMSSFGPWALSAKDQNFVDAILIAGVKKHDDA